MYSLPKVHYLCQTHLQWDVMRMVPYGTIKIKLSEQIEEKGISKNKLSQRAEMQRTQLNNYCNNKISRLDIDVLGRLCTVSQVRICV